jgi:hypothetical protein
MFRCRLAVLLLAIVFVASHAHARKPIEVPPATAQPLSRIVRVVEDEGHTVIPSITFGDEVWILRVYKAGLQYEIRVDPVTAEILSLRPK